MRKPAAPSDLGRAGTRLWRDIVAGWEMGEPDLVLLLQACRVADHLDELNEAARDVSAIITGRPGQVTAHPLFAEIRAERRALVNLLRALGFTSDAPEPAEPGPRVIREKPPA